MGKFVFKKSEKLNREKWIKELFDKGSSFNLYPFRIRYQPHPDPQSAIHQVLISVSVRNFKKAVDRNLIKRRIREAWRLNREYLKTESSLLIAYIYTAKEIEDFAKIQSGVRTAMNSVAEKISTKFRKESGVK